MLFAVAQFHISNISNEGISGEIYKFLLECYSCVAQLQKLDVTFPERSAFTKMYYIIYYILHAVHPLFNTTKKFLLKIFSFYEIDFKYEKGKDELISERHFKC